MKKKKKLLPEEFKPAFSLAGTSIGSSLLGGALQSKLPSGVTNPLTSIGSTTSKFISPIATIGATGFAFKQLKKIQMKGGKKK